MPTPNIQIEVLQIDANTVYAAIYYAVPANLQLASAVDVRRAQFGTRLDAASLLALQNGAIYGEIITRTVVGMTPAQIAALLQSEYAAYAATAAKNYADKYRNTQYLGKAFDGAAWG